MCPKKVELFAIVTPRSSTYTDIILSQAKDAPFSMAYGRALVTA